MDSADLINICEKWVKSIHSQNPHLIRTGYWLKKLSNNTSPELIIAGVTHDIERSFSEDRNPVGSSEDGPGVIFDDPEYNLWHGRRSAEFVGDFLRKYGASDKFINHVQRLIITHEIGGDSEQNLVKDADSISFLENNVELFIARIPSRLSVQQVRAKIDYMFKRISSDKARRIALPFYQKALRELLKTYPS